MTDLYIVKDNISVALSPSARVEETLTNDLYIKGKGMTRGRRDRLKEVTKNQGSTIRVFQSADSTCRTKYPILEMTAVWNNNAGTGPNYYTGGSFNFKTITLGNAGASPALVNNQTVYIDYTGASGDTIVVDTGMVKDNYLITGNLVSNAEGSVQDKKDDIKYIFKAGGNVTLTYPSQDNSVNVFPTRITFVQNAGELEQAELILEAIFGYDKT